MASDKQRNAHPSPGSTELEPAPAQRGRPPATRDAESARSPAPGAGAPQRVSGPREAPPRPKLDGKQSPPVIVSLPPPVSIRLAIIGWVLSLIAGAAAIVYLFAIRAAQLPEITEIIATVDPDRPEETQELAADIIVWVMFGVLVAVILLQILFLVAFANRRPRTRWWLFGTLVVLGLTFLLGRELVAVGDRGIPLERILLLQLGLATLGLLFSFLPGALRWSARRHDVIRRSEATVGDL